MSALSRAKGQAGERELARLLTELSGRDVTRRVRQHSGDSDLLGLDGWAIECKRARAAPLALIAREWWPQAVAQARAHGGVPLLCFRADRAPWRAVWPAWIHRPELRSDHVLFADALVSDLLTWWRLCRHVKALGA
jgi:Holliday junction resolvase